MLAIEVELGISSRLVTDVLSNLIRERGEPQWIRVDNVPEFVSSTLNDWCHQQGVRLQFIQPGKPSQN